MLISPLPSCKRLQYHFDEPLKFVVVVAERATVTLTVGWENGSEHHGTFFGAGSYDPLTLISLSERILEQNGGIIARLELHHLMNAVWFPLYHIGTSWAIQEWKEV